MEQIVLIIALILALAAVFVLLMRLSKARTTNARLEERLALITQHNSQLDQANREQLFESIHQLMDLNRTIGSETRRLTDALKGNSRMQGDWGEMILENILERSGLTRGREFTVQGVVADEDGSRLRPDVIVNMPGDRCLVIDSKVSVQSYLNMLNAETPSAREAEGRAHVASVRKHIAELARKNYQDYVGSGRKVDFVIMFVPHEGAYLAAMNLDPTIWQTAYDSHVVIASATHLMAVTKLVEQMWQQENRSENAERIADEAAKMLDKFNGFLEDMDRLDRSIRATRDTWDQAYRKLTGGPGNLISKAERLSQFGVKTKKRLPQRFQNEGASDSE